MVFLGQIIGTETIGYSNLSENVLSVVLRILCPGLHSEMEHLVYFEQNSIIAQRKPDMMGQNRISEKKRAHCVVTF